MRLRKFIPWFKSDSCYELCSSNSMPKAELPSSVVAWVLENQIGEWVDYNSKVYPEVKRAILINNTRIMSLVNSGISIYFIKGDFLIPRKEKRR
jgi:hypothetical protein